MSIGTYVQHHVPHVPTHVGGRPIIAATLGLAAVVAIAVSVIVVRDGGGDTAVTSRPPVTLQQRADMMARIGVPYGGGVAGVEALRSEYYANLERARILEAIGVPFGPVNVAPAATGPTTYNPEWKFDRLGDGGDAVYSTVAVSGADGASWKLDRLGDGGDVVYGTVAVSEADGASWKLDRLGDGGDAVYGTTEGGGIDYSWIHEDTNLPEGLHQYPQ